VGEDSDGRPLPRASVHKRYRILQDILRRCREANPASVTEWLHDAKTVLARSPHLAYTLDEVNAAATILLEREAAAPTATAAPHVELVDRSIDWTKVGRTLVAAGLMPKKGS